MSGEDRDCRIVAEYTEKWAALPITYVCVDGPTGSYAIARIEHNLTDKPVWLQ
jgi:hypothetical protein